MLGSLGIINLSNCEVGFLVDWIGLITNHQL